MLQPFISFFTSPHVALAMKILYQTSFVWLPALLFILLWELWITYVRAKFFAKQEYVLLEMKLPREIFKSPLAMEIFFNGLHQTGQEGDWWVRNFKGQTRPWYSLEIVSIDGSIHFFIWTRKGLKNVIEASLYSQFPGIEVYEAPDYTLLYSYDPEKNSLWAKEFALTKPDPFPIKTYVDYGMDKDPKEEYRIDPMTPLIEFMGSLGREHQAWIQIIIRAHKAEDKNPDGGKPIDKKWEKGAGDEIKKILEKTKGEKGEDGKPGPARRLTKGEEEVVHAIERSISKLGFDVGIRAIYTASKDLYSAGNTVGIMGGFKNYNSNNLNGFKPQSHPEGEYKYFPFIKRPKKTIDKEKRKLLNSYKHRAWFYNEFKKPSFVLNTEELATIFHFPAGGLATSPSFTRIGSKKSEAPSNLPI